VGDCVKKKVTFLEPHNPYKNCLKHVVEEKELEDEEKLDREL